MNSKPAIGRLYGIGVGPGDPQLLTLRAYHVLSQVPVIFVPQKNKESESIARSILCNLTPEMESKITGLVLPMMRNKKLLREHWYQAAETIRRHLETGKDCALVNVGDPLLYGTFIHILKTLKENYPEVKVEVIPGISSINAAAARTVTPLASDDDNIAIISGKCDEKAIRETLENFNTVVFLKMSAIFDSLLTILEDMQLMGKCVFVRRCTTNEEEIITDISRLKDRPIDYFSLLIVRK